jgi:hypothetical protein
MEQEPYKKQNIKIIHIKSILAMMVCVLMLYSSCRKAENAPGPSTTKSTSADALGSQMAVNLAKSLAGTYGGVNLNDGVDSVSLADHNGPQHACTCTKNSLCGFYTDSLVNYNSNEGDTAQVHTGGNLKFYFNCVDGKPSGYSAYDSLNTVRTTAKSVSQYNVKQWYTIQSLDDNHLFIGVNGTNDLHTSITYPGTSKAPEIGGAFYELKDLKIDLTQKDILSGTATFKSYGSNWNLNGTITFLGNHMADVTANGKTYHIDLLTGKSS